MSTLWKSGNAAFLLFSGSIVIDDVAFADSSGFNHVTSSRETTTDISLATSVERKLDNRLQAFFGNSCKILQWPELRLVIVDGD